MSLQAAPHEFFKARHNGLTDENSRLSVPPHPYPDFSSYFLTNGPCAGAGSPHASYQSAPEEKISDWAEATFPCSSDTSHAFCSFLSLLKSLTSRSNFPSQLSTHLE